MGGKAASYASALDHSAWINRTGLSRCRSQRAVDRGLKTARSRQCCREGSKISSHVGARLRRRRESPGIKIQHLAALTGASFQQIQKYQPAQNRIATSPALSGIDHYEIERASARLLELRLAWQRPAFFRTGRHMIPLQGAKLVLAFPFKEAVVPALVIFSKPDQPGQTLLLDRAHTHRSA